MTQKDRLGEALVIAGIVAFAWYKYSKLTEAEKTDIQNDIKETGKKVLKEFVPAPIHGFLPAALR